MSRCRWKACKHRTRLSGNNQTDLPSWDETFKRGQGKSLAGLLLCLVGRAVLSVSWPGSGLVWLKFPTVAEACPERGHQEKTESGLISKNQKMYKNFYCNTQQKLPVGVCVFTLLLSTSACIFSLSLSLFFFVYWRQQRRIIEWVWLFQNFTHFLGFPSGGRQKRSVALKTLWRAAGELLKSTVFQAPSHILVNLNFPNMRQRICLFIHSFTHSFI